MLMSLSPAGLEGVSQVIWSLCAPGCMGRAESWAQFCQTFPMWQQGEKEERGDGDDGKVKRKNELMSCRNGHRARPPQIIKHGQVQESSIKVPIKTLALKWIYWMRRRSWGAE